MIEALKLVDRRLGALNVALAALFVAGSVAFMIGDRNEDVIKPSYAAMAFFALLFVPLAWRRAAALAAIGATLALLVAHIALFGEMVRCGILIPLAMLLAFSAGSRLSGRQSLFGLALVIGFLLVMCLADSAEGAPVAAMLFLAPVSAVVWAGGRLVQSHRGKAQVLAERTRELHETRERRAALEVTADRVRVSAELDELLQRRLAELAAMAEAGSRITDPALAAGALRELEGESRRTLDQMRAVVGVLRHDAGGLPPTPQPTLTHLDAMLLQSRGGDASLTIEGSPRALPAGVELSAYRIVEHLLAALGDAPVEVRVRFGEEALELAVSGSARRPDPAAIKRAEERVHLHHGTLSSTSSGGRAETVASLPMLVGA
jgi:hypothetical protein